MKHMSLIVNGDKIPLNNFTQKIIESIIRGALKALHDVDSDGAIEISIPQAEAPSRNQ